MDYKEFNRLDFVMRDIYNYVYSLKDQLEMFDDYYDDTNVEDCLEHIDTVLGYMKYYCSSILAEEKAKEKQRKWDEAHK